jgi:hypothetical protein
MIQKLGCRESYYCLHQPITIAASAVNGTPKGAKWHPSTVLRFASVAGLPCLLSFLKTSAYRDSGSLDLLVELARPNKSHQLFDSIANVFHGLTNDH